MLWVVVEKVSMLLVLVEPDDSNSEAIYNKEVQFVGKRVGGSRLTFQR